MNKKGVSEKLYDFWYTLFLADEPTGNLDSKNGKEVMELLSELHKEGTTIVMAPHSLHDANYVYISSSMNRMISSCRSG